MSILILLRSLTYAQKAQRMLWRRGIHADVVKAPQGSSDRGCTYAVKVSRREAKDALRFLREEKLETGRILQRDEYGDWEVTEL